MNEQARVGVRTHAWGPTELGHQVRDRIFFLASRGAVFQGLFQAVRHHFSGFEVTLVDRLPEAESPDEDVRLVLLSPGRGWNFAACALECHHQFPSAAIGLIVDDAAQAMDDCEAVFDKRLVQGLLPLSLPLDVWLAAMSLLISGGEYFPVEMMRRSRGMSDAQTEAVRGHLASGAPELRDIPAHPRTGTRSFAMLPEHHDRPANGEAHLPRIDTLTARERQILKLVSEGYQNKLIADRMALSEHTVKAHVHNLIAKLRVSNRTQAAAAFLAAHERATSSDRTDDRTSHTSRENGPDR